MTRRPRTYIAKKLPFQPFGVERLALISKLQRIGFHNYQNKWTKRFGKNFGRWLFDFAYHQLELSGQGCISVKQTDQVRQLTFDGRKLHYDRLFNNQFFNLCEPELATLLETFLTGDKVFYDIGANWGYFSLYATTLPNYTGPIFAFEPIQETYNDLNDWIEQTAQSSRVSVHQLAISDRDGSAQMGIVPTDSGLASLARAQDDGSINFQVQTSRLDSLEHPPPDFIKLDVEGFEPEVLEGSQNILLHKKPMVMFENWIIKDDPERTLLPIKKIMECGYQLFVPMWWADTPTNDLFWPKAHQAFPEGTKLMAYVPFDIDDRFILRDQINFFCCHVDRIEELATLFTVID